MMDYDRINKSGIYLIKLADEYIGFNEPQLLRLENILSGLGVYITLLPNNILAINVFFEYIGKKRFKGGGKKKKACISKYTYGEVKEKLRGSKYEDIAVELGVSRSTLFRRLSFYLANSIGDDELFL